MHNLLASDSDLSTLRVAGRPLQEVVSRLNALTMVLKSCKRSSCTHPWRALHPDGNVSTLSESLDRRFDEFYATQPRVSFTKCELGFISESEGPMDFNVFGESSMKDQSWGFGEL
jgi:N-acetylglucosamine-6-sulfatase